MGPGSDLREGGEFNNKIWFQMSQTTTGSGRERWGGGRWDSWDPESPPSRDGGREGEDGSDPLPLSSPLSPESGGVLTRALGKRDWDPTKDPREVWGEILVQWAARPSHLRSFSRPFFSLRGVWGIPPGG